MQLQQLSLSGAQFPFHCLLQRRLLKSALQPSVTMALLHYLVRVLASSLMLTLHGCQDPTALAPGGEPLDPIRDKALHLADQA